MVVLDEMGKTIQWHNTDIHQNGHIYTLDTGNHSYNHQDNTVAWDNTLILDGEATTQNTEHFVSISWKIIFYVWLYSVRLG